MVNLTLCTGSLTITSVASTEVEVIIARDVNNVNVQGYVRWIIFRFHLFKAWKADELPRALSKLARLEKVVLVCETECPLIPASWKPLKDKVHIWSIAKAKAHAQDMMRNGIPSEASEQFPVSSRWRCAFRYNLLLYRSDDDGSKDDGDSEGYWFNSWTIDDQWAMSGEELKFEERDPGKNES